MDKTSLSLLQRVCDESDSESWQTLADLYTPLLQRWLRRYGLQSSDADDLVQDVLMAVAQDLPKFQHTGRSGAFRAWLRGIVAGLDLFRETRQEHAEVVQLSVQLEPVALHLWIIE
jgi:RNA polymerase sigma-70 factor (ECF subfamily)